MSQHTPKGDFIRACAKLELNRTEHIEYVAQMLGVGIPAKSASIPRPQVRRPATHEHPRYPSESPRAQDGQMKASESEEHFRLDMSQDENWQAHDTSAGQPNRNSQNDIPSAKPISFGEVDQRLTPHKAPPSLFPIKRKRELIVRAIGSWLPIGKLEVETLVHSAASGRLPRTLPRAKVWGVREGCDLLIDMGRRMDAFRLDQHQLAREIMRLPGMGLIRVFYFTGVPSANLRVTPHGAVVSYLPRRNVPVLVLTRFVSDNVDFQYSGSGRSNDNGSGSSDIDMAITPDEEAGWSSFSRQIRQAGGRVTVFMPDAAGFTRNWPNGLDIHPWSWLARTSGSASIKSRKRLEKNGSDLRSLAGLAVLAEPHLLRELGLRFTSFCPSAELYVRRMGLSGPDGVIAAKSFDELERLMNCYSGKRLEVINLIRHFQSEGSVAGELKFERELIWALLLRDTKRLNELLYRLVATVSQVQGDDEYPVAAWAMGVLTRLRHPLVEAAPPAWMTVIAATSRGVEGSFWREKQPQSNEVAALLVLFTHRLLDLLRPDAPYLSIESQVDESNNTIEFRCVKSGGDAREGNLNSKSNGDRRSPGAPWKRISVPATAPIIIRVQTFFEEYPPETEFIFLWKDDPNNVRGKYTGDRFEVAGIDGLEYTYHVGNEGNTNLGGGYISPAQSRAGKPFRITVTAPDSGDVVNELLNWWAGCTPRHASVVCGDPDRTGDINIAAARAAVQGFLEKVEKPGSCAIIECELNGGESSYGQVIRRVGALAGQEEKVDLLVLYGYCEDGVDSLADLVAEHSTRILTAGSVALTARDVRTFQVRKFDRQCLIDWVKKILPGVGDDVVNHVISMGGDAEIWIEVISRLNRDGDLSSEIVEILHLAGNDAVELLYRLLSLAVRTRTETFTEDYSSILSHSSIRRRLMDAYRSVDSNGRLDELIAWCNDKRHIELSLLLKNALGARKGKAIGAAFLGVLKGLSLKSLGQESLICTWDFRSKAGNAYAEVLSEPVLEAGEAEELSRYMEEFARFSSAHQILSTHAACRAIKRIPSRDSEVGPSLRKFIDSAISGSRGQAAWTIARESNEAADLDKLLNNFGSLSGEVQSQLIASIVMLDLAALIESLPEDGRQVVGVLRGRRHPGKRGSRLLTLLGYWHRARAAAKKSGQPYHDASRLDCVPGDVGGMDSDPLARWLRKGGGGWTDRYSAMDLMESISKINAINDLDALDRIVRQDISTILRQSGEAAGTEGDQLCGRILCYMELLGIQVNFFGAGKPVTQEPFRRALQHL